MSNSTLINLPAATTLTGTELIYGTQSSADVKITTSQIGTSIGAPIIGGATTQVLFNLAGKVSSDSGFTYAGSGGVIQVGTTINFAGATSSFPALVRSGTGLLVQLADGSNFASLTVAGLNVGLAGGAGSSAINNTGIRLGSGLTISWSSTTAQNGTLDTQLARGAAGIIQFVSTGSFSANNTVATSITSVGPTGANTTVQEWLTIKNASGTTRYIPCF